MLLCIAGAFEDGGSSELHWKSQVLMDQISKYKVSWVFLNLLPSPPAQSIQTRNTLKFFRTSQCGLQHFLNSLLRVVNDKNVQM